MASTVVPAAGFSGLYAETIRPDALKGERGHPITVVSPYPEFFDVCSPAWAGIGQAKPEAARFEQGPGRDRPGYDFLIQVQC